MVAVGAPGAARLVSVPTQGFETARWRSLLPGLSRVQTRADVRRPRVVAVKQCPGRDLVAGQVDRGVDQLIRASTGPPRVTPMPAPHLLHHLGVFASDFAASESFYTNALAALDVRAGYRTETIAEYWIPEHDAPSLSLESARTSAEVTRGLHVAFEAADRNAVDAFHEAAVKAGGTSRNEPRHWPEYRAYAAFVSDPDGNNVEALVKDANVS